MRVQETKTVVFVGINSGLGERLGTELRRSKDFVFARSYTSVRELFAVGAGDQPNIVLLGDLEGAERTLTALLTLKRLWPTVPVIVLGDAVEMATFLRAFQIGANGFVLLPITRESLEPIMSDALQGWRCFCRRAQKLLLDQFARVNSSRESLTPAEVRIMNNLIWNLSDKEIAVATGHATATIHSITARIYKKLQVHSRMDAVNAYLGLIEPSQGKRTRSLKSDSRQTNQKSSQRAETVGI